MNEQVDVLVVGGGPAGLATAQRIADKGYKVLVVHRDKHIGQPVRTSGGSWQSDMVRLGIPDHLYQPIQSLIFAGPSKQHCVAFENNPPVVLDVTRTYCYLAELAEHSGAAIRCATSFERVLEKSPDQIVCSVVNAGRHYRISSRYVVDASGYQRVVLNHFGMTDKYQRFGVGAEYEYVNKGDATQATLFVGTEFAPSGYGWVFPTVVGTVRVGVGVIRPDTPIAPKQLLENFLKSDMIKRFNLHIGEETERHFGVIPSDGPAESFVYDRCIAVGDSVGQALPVVGEGIRYCIESGRKAGEAIANALKQPQGASGYFAQYSAWWNQHYRRSFTYAQKANCRMGTYDDKKWNEVIQMLSLMDRDSITALLRAEFSGKHVAKELCRNPVSLAYHLSKRLLRHAFAG